MADGLQEPTSYTFRVWSRWAKVYFCYRHGSANPDWPARLSTNTYPRDDKLSTKVLYFSLDFATDVELVAVESYALKVGQQVLLAG